MNDEEIGTEKEFYNSFQTLFFIIISKTTLSLVKSHINRSCSYMEFLNGFDPVIFLHRPSKNYLLLFLWSKKDLETSPADPLSLMVWIISLGHINGNYYDSATMEKSPLGYRMPFISLIRQYGSTMHKLCKVPPMGADEWPCRGSGPTNSFIWRPCPFGVLF